MKKLTKAALALALMWCAAPVLAQPYPSKPIRFIVGFPPGGSADPTTRIVGQALSEQLGQPLLVENRPGADSAIAAEQVTKLPADGYTIMFASNSAMTAAVALRKNPTYDPLTDFTPVSMVGRATVHQWAGVFGPPKMPRDIVDRLNKEIGIALKRPDVLEKLQSYGYAAESSTPERLLEINRDDLALWRRLVREAGIPLE